MPQGHGWSPMAEYSWLPLKAAEASAAASASEDS
jgi:hypothetical protein